MLRGSCEPAVSLSSGLHMLTHMEGGHGLAAPAKELHHGSARAARLRTRKGGEQGRLAPVGEPDDLYSGGRGSRQTLYDIYTRQAVLRRRKHNKHIRAGREGTPREVSNAAATLPPPTLGRAVKLSHHVRRPPLQEGSPLPAARRVGRDCLRSLHWWACVATDPGAEGIP